MDGWMDLREEGREVWGVVLLEEMETVPLKKNSPALKVSQI